MTFTASVPTGNCPPPHDLDFGDAPDTYQTLSGSNGASHVVLDDFHLGVSIDAESNGKPTAAGSR